jgi:hypothetical protein
MAPAPAAAAAPPPAGAGGLIPGVDDCPDPVRALQTLRELREVNKVDAATFEMKRAMLLQQLQARR